MKGARTLALALCTAVVGCQLPQPGPAEFDVRLGDGAPEFGSGDTTKTLTQFVIGHWALTDYVDPEFSRQLGLGALAKEMADQPVIEVFEFRADGTFQYKRLKANWVVAGKWQDTGNAVILTYQTYNGKPLQQAQEESKRAAEGGTQAAVANDLLMDGLTGNIQKLTTLQVASNKRILVFTSTEGGQIQLAAGSALERLTNEAKK